MEATAMMCLNLKLSASLPTGIIITRRVKDAAVRLFWIIDYAYYGSATVLPTKLATQRVRKEELRMMLILIMMFE